MEGEESRQQAPSKQKLDPFTGKPVEPKGDKAKGSSLEKAAEALSIN